MSLSREGGVQLNLLMGGPTHSLNLTQFHTSNGVSWNDLISSMVWNGP